MTPEQKEFAAAVEHRAIEKGIQKNDISSFYFPIHSGADPNRRNDDGVTLLEMAIELQRVEVVGFLASIPEVDKTVKTSKGQDPLEFAKEMRVKLADAHEDVVLGADAIVDLIENPKSARLFRAAYNVYIDKMLKKNELKRQGMFGTYFVVFVLGIHAYGFAYPGSETNDLLQMSPILHLFNWCHRVITTRLLGFGGKEEL